MRDATPPDAASQRPMAVIGGSMKPAGWRLANFNQSTIGPRSGSREHKYYLESSPGYSAIHDFERRLSRNGIKKSEANSIHASNAATHSTVHDRGGAVSTQGRYAQASTQRGVNHHVSRSEDFPLLQAPAMISFTNTKKETEVEALERQLRQAQTEARVWKERCEAQEVDLRASYKEAMEWRMKYEDLYSTVLRDLDSEITSRVKRGATQSLG